MLLFAMPHSILRTSQHILKLPERQGSTCFGEAENQVSDSFTVFQDNIYLFIVNKRNTEKGVEYFQSQQGAIFKFVST